MNILLDTHVALWVSLRADLLKPWERSLLARDDVTTLVSAISLWELRLKWNLFTINGVRKGPADPADVLAALNRQGIVTAALTPEQASRSLARPVSHRDPFDEMLLIHAQELDARLLTRDDDLLGHPLALHP